MDGEGCAQGIPKGKSAQWEVELPTLSTLSEKCGVAELVSSLQRSGKLCSSSVHNPSVDASPDPRELLTDLLRGTD